MRIDTVSPELSRMLAKAGRSDLLGGFDLDDAAFERSLRISHSRDVAIYHCLFDKGAAHAATINPMPPPEASSSNDEMARWVVEKQAELARLQTSTVQGLADQVSAAVKASGDIVSASVGALSTIATNGHGEIEGHATSLLSALRANNSATCEQLQWLDGHVAEGNSLASASLSAIRQIAAKQEAQALSALGELTESIRSVAVEINESSGRRSGHILAVLENAAESDRERWEEAAIGRVARWKREDDSSEIRERAATLWRRIHAALLLAILIALLAGKAHAQPSSPLIMGAKASGSAVANSKRQSGPYYIDCGASTTFTVATSTLNCSGSGGSTALATGNYYPPFGSMMTGSASTGGVAANAVVCWEAPFANSITPARILFEQYGAWTTSLHAAWAFYSTAGNLIYQTAVYTGGTTSNGTGSVAFTSPSALSAGTEYSLCYTDDSASSLIIGNGINYLNTLLTGYGINGGAAPMLTYTAANSSTAVTLAFPATLGAKTANLTYGTPHVILIAQ